MGFKPMKTIIQQDTIDIELRTDLWNHFYLIYLEDPANIKKISFPLWMDFFGLPVDSVPPSPGGVYEWLRGYFFKAKWYEVYDFIEFIAGISSTENLNSLFMILCNICLEKNLSAYRFVGNKIAPLTSEQETAEIDKALEDTSSIKSVNVHLRRAIELFADKKPDYRNSIKESISAVEAICNLILGSNNSSLGDALKRIEREHKVVIHPALKVAFEKLYGYTSSSDGIRHALLEESTLGQEDAKFMLVSCSAFINYLIAKSLIVGIKLD